MGTVGYLLDTHTFLWAVSEYKKLGIKAGEIISDASSLLYLSAASAYEITNKKRIGRLAEYEKITENYFYIIKTLNVTELAISTQHAHFAGEFEWEHRDPFDRLLAAQAYIDSLTLITNDKNFNTLKWVETLW